MSPLACFLTAKFVNKSILILKFVSQNLPDGITASQLRSDITKKHQHPQKFVNGIMQKNLLKAAACAAIATAMASCSTSGTGTLRCEYLVNPIGIDDPAPRFTWTAPDGAGKSYVVEVATSENDLKSGKLLWKSAVLPGTTLSTVYNGTPLQSHTRYVWRVVADGHPSATAIFETSKMSQSDWEAQWITDGLDKEYEPAPMMRKSFSLTDIPDNARAYISAAGYYTLWINGKRVGDSHMDPGYTQYDKRNLYATYDVTDLLRKGENTVAAVLGNGFYNCQSKAVWDFETAYWRGRPSMIFELRGTGRDGVQQILAASDSTWRTSTGPYTYNNIYSGDRYDGRLEPTGWTAPGFDDTAWQSAHATQSPSPLLKSQTMPSIRPVENIVPTLLQSWGDSIYVFDMGKNITGVATIATTGERGTEFKLSYGELLKNNGRLEQGNLDIYYHPQKPGEKFQTDEFILAGTGSTESFTPMFTYHGFRYVEVRSDRPVKLTAENITGHFMHTDVKPAGSFACSEPLLEKIHAATMLSYLGNMHSIPTDCPQREKNGWTADAHVSVDLGLLNYDGITFYEKWMNDFIDNQRDNGNISGIIPSAGWGFGEWPGPVWDAALFIIPEALYDYYGDSRTIERLYPTMERYFKWAGSLEKEEGILTNGIGDWLSYSANTPTDFTGTVYYYLDNMKMARFARILGKDPKPYADKAERLKQIINNRWFNEADATYANGTQAALGVALYAGIVPSGKEQAVADALHKAVEARDYHLDFGLLGSKTVPAMLSKYGYLDDAYRMATKTDAPSWGYWIEECGYTTLPETWTLSPEFRDASLNHVFMGDISAWMTNVLAGINHDPAHPGFGNVIIRPMFPTGLDSAEGVYESVRGTIRSSWQREGDEVTLTVTIPAATTATVYAPDPQTVGEGTHKYRFRI